MNFSGLLRLAVQSIRNRALTTTLTVISIALSVALLIGVEHIRTSARESFQGTISQTDLIVGARSGPIQLLLYSVFHMGSATSNISFESYEKYRDHPAVEWTTVIAGIASSRPIRIFTSIIGTAATGGLSCKMVQPRAIFSTSCSVRKSRRN